VSNDPQGAPGPQPEQPLDPSELIPCITAPLPDAKEIAAACESAEIFATLARAACCGKSGCACAPKIQVLVERGDVPKVAKLLSERWWQLMEREGTLEGTPQLAGEAPEGEHPPCPACGTAAPLVEGACSDCGLQLE
jgi:hypothetical protein